MLIAALFYVMNLLFSIGQTARAQPVPLPHERPPIANDRSSASASRWSSCDLRLTEIAQFQPGLPITGPGECIAGDVVLLDAVLLPNGAHVTITPPATLICSMAEAVAHWVRDDIAPAVAMLGTTVRSIKTAGSFSCRGRNGIIGATISEHGHANALDVNSFKLANGTTIELTDSHASKSLRERFRQSACARFSTVLGNGADAYHEGHVHLDLIERSNDYRICEWDVLDQVEAAERAAGKTALTPPMSNSGIQAGHVPLPRPRPTVNALAQPSARHASASPRRQAQRR